jgi:Uma2 family endonuclease
MAILTANKPASKRKIPTHLIKEEMDGVPYYYKGFREVLAKKKTFEEIMGSSVLQVIILDAIKRYLYGAVSKDFIIASNEAGLHLQKNDNVANDIAIYRKEDIKNFFSKKYFDVPPKLVIEVDIDIEADVEKAMELQYVLKKTNKLLDFGVEKVIWIFSEDRKIIIAEPQSDWVITNWNTDITLMNGLVLNLENLLKENSIF